MARSEFRWDVPPTAFKTSLDRFDAAARKALGDVADLYAPQMEAYAKNNAPWTDRTGDARKTIKALVTKEPDSVEIALFGTMEYFPFLELGTSKMRPYPIIVPTLQKYHAPVMSAVRRIVED